MADEAVMDVGLEAPDTSVETTEVNAPDTGLDTQPEGDQTTQPDGKPAGPLFENGKPSQAVKQTLDQLKATNPQLGRQIENALYQQGRFMEEFPGGMKEVRQIAQAYQDLGGEHGLQEMQGELSGFRQFDEQFTAGDPKAIEFMTSDPAGQTAFLKLIPTALDKFRTLHPDGYSNHMAQVMLATLDTARVPLDLERLSDFIGDNPKAQEVLGRIQNTMKWLGGLATKTPEPPKIAAPQAPSNDIDQREANLTRQEWGRESATAQNAHHQRVIQDVLQGKQLSEDQAQDANDLIKMRLNAALNAKTNGQPSHAEILDRYRAKGDKDGFLRYAASLNSKVMEPIIRKVLGPFAAPAKPGPKPGTQPGQKPPMNNKPAAAGFTRVNERPSRDSIDLRNRFNTPQNWLAGKAILTDGRKVDFSHIRA